MKAQRRSGWRLPLLVAGGLLAGCGRGNVGPAELFLDSMLSAVTSSQAPDLWVSSVAGPPSALEPTGYFVTVTACNQGTVSASSTVDLYLSEDTRIDATDPRVGGHRTFPRFSTTDPGPTECPTECPDDRPGDRHGHHPGDRLGHHLDHDHHPGDHPGPVELIGSTAGLTPRARLTAAQPLRGGFRLGYPAR